MRKVFKYALELIAFMMIWFAVEYGRTPYDKLELFSNGWILQLILIVVAFTIIRLTDSK